MEVGFGFGRALPLWAFRRMRARRGLRVLRCCAGNGKQEPLPTVGKAAETNTGRRAGQGWKAAWR